MDIHQAGHLIQLFQERYGSPPLDLMWYLFCVTSHEQQLAVR